MSPILKYNLLVFAVMAVLGASLSPFTEGASAVLFGVGFLVQAGLNGLWGLVQLVRGQPDWGFYLLSALLVALVGVGTCSAIAATGLFRFSVH